MNLDIKLHKVDLPDQIKFSDKIAIDCEFMGLNVERDRLCLVQISSGHDDAHIIQLNKEKYNAPNLKKILVDQNINKIFHFFNIYRETIVKPYNICESFACSLFCVFYIIS